MHYKARLVYHLHNTGINNQQIFIDDFDYNQFADYLRKFVAPYADILGYVFLPGSFDIVIQSKYLHGIDTNTAFHLVPPLQRGIGLWLSRYAVYFNKKYKRTGSLFRQKSKVKQVEEKGKDANEVVMYFLEYIHSFPASFGYERGDRWRYDSSREWEGSTEWLLRREVISRWRERVEIIERRVHNLTPKNALSDIDISQNI